MLEWRRMEKADVPHGLRLCRLSNWNQLSKDWEIFLKLSTHCFVAIKNEAVVGTVATITYENKFSWIGMVLVDPAQRGKGIGSQLLQKALDDLQDIPTIKLDATDAGRQVYLKLGFADEYKISRMISQRLAVLPATGAARPIEENDLSEIAAFDEKFFGANRKPLLQLIWEEGKEFAFVVKNENNIQGYCMGRPGFQFAHIGPVVADTFQVAKALVSAVVKNSLPPILLDATHFQPGWISWLNRLGFSEQRSFTRMYKGEPLSKEIPEKQFAILGPEFG